MSDLNPQLQAEQDAARAAQAQASRETRETVSQRRALTPYFERVRLAGDAFGTDIEISMTRKARSA